MGLVVTPDQKAPEETRMILCLHIKSVDGGTMCFLKFLVLLIIKHE